MTQNGPYPGQPSQPWSAGGSDDAYQEPADPWGEHNDGWGGNPASTPPGAGGTTDTHPPGYGAAAPDYGVTGVQPTGYPPTGVSPTGLPLPGQRLPGQPLTGMPLTGQPLTGIPLTGMPLTGMPLTGIPLTGMPGWAAPPARRRGPGKPIVVLVVVLGLLICGGLGTTAWLLAHRGDKGTTQAAPPTPTATRTAVSDTDPRPQNSQDARFVAKGQCVRNEGTADSPQMSIAVCTSGAYEVLARIDGRTTGEADAETKCAKVKHYTKWYFYDSELDSLDFVLCLRER
jgi:hypothetical protein